jgi:hypothetical protein
VIDFRFDFDSNIDFVKRVRHLTYKIYGELLCTTRDARMTYISSFIMGGDADHVQSSTFSWYRIVLSRDLLYWITSKDATGVPCSFTNFITTPELSGPLYIISDIYHTQIAEYILEKTYHQ